MDRRKFLIGGISASILSACGMKPKSHNISQNKESSILELFNSLKTNSKLSPEKGYEFPQYRNEKFPTIIIIGDIHGEQINSPELIKKLKNKFIVEKNESFEKEISAVKELIKLTQIHGIGIEGDSIGRISSSYNPIAIELLKIKIPLYGLSNELLLESQILINFLIQVYQIKLFSESSKISKEIDLSSRSDEFFVNKKIGNINSISTALQIIQNSEPIIENGTLEQFDAYMFWLYHTFEYFSQNYLDHIFDEISKKYSKELNFKPFEISQFMLQENYKIFKQINNIVAQETKKIINGNEIFVIIYGKLHIDEIFNNLNKEFNGKVNIYVAK